MERVKFENLTQEQKDNLLKSMIVMAQPNDPNGVVFLENFTKYGAEAFDNHVEVSVGTIDGNEAISFKKSV